MSCFRKADNFALKPDKTCLNFVGMIPQTLKQKILILLFFTILIVSLSMIIVAITTKKNAIDYQAIASQLHNGDIIFRRGHSVESRAVLLYDQQKEFSHVGMVYFQNNQANVIHAVPYKTKEKEYVKKETLKNFLSPKNASNFAVYRPQIESNKKLKLAQQALYFYQNKIVFDNNYNLQTNNEMYCTELILKAFQRADIPLGDMRETTINLIFKKHNILMPSTLQKSKSLKRIIIQ